VDFSARPSFFSRYHGSGEKRGPCRYHGTCMVSGGKRGPCEKSTTVILRRGATAGRGADGSTMGPARRYRVVHAPRVAVRSSPSTSGAIVGCRPFGQEFPVFEEAGGWVRVVQGVAAWSKCSLGGAPARLLRLLGHAWRRWAARHSQEEDGPLGAPPPPRVLQRATSQAADFTAVEHSGERDAWMLVDGSELGLGLLLSALPWLDPPVVIRAFSLALAVQLPSFPQGAGALHLRVQALDDENGARVLGPFEAAARQRPVDVLGLRPAQRVRLRAEAAAGSEASGGRLEPLEASGGPQLLTSAWVEVATRDLPPTSDLPSGVPGRVGGMVVGGVGVDVMGVARGVCEALTLR
jgi:hypothetical protein